jgi:ADP-ribose pyrophosphatase YjhB (NUDIX family)
MMLEHHDGSVTMHGIRFVPLMVRVKKDAFAPVSGVYAIPGGGVAGKHDLPEIARRMREWMENGHGCDQPN